MVVRIRPGPLCSAPYLSPPGTSVGSPCSSSLPGHLDRLRISPGRSPNHAQAADQGVSGTSTPDEARRARNCHSRPPVLAFQYSAGIVARCRHRSTILAVKTDHHELPPIYLQYNSNRFIPYLGHLGLERALRDQISVASSRGHLGNPRAQRCRFGLGSFKTSLP